MNLIHFINIKVGDIIKAAIYIRVSTEEQALEGYSIDAQKNRGIEYCNRMGYEIVGFYVDEGISGKSLNRPKVQELIEDAKKKLFNVVVVYKLDRFTRSLKDLVNVLELFSKYNISLKSTTEDLDVSSLSGKAMVQMLGVFAEFERGTISERVSLGLEQRARIGLYDAGGSPFGYIYDPNTKEYYINEEQAAIVREIFQLHQSGKGIAYICRVMNQRGVKTSNGKMFYRSFLKRMFSTGWYLCGYRYFRGRNTTFIERAKNIPVPILTLEEFEKSNKIYGANYVSVRTSPKENNYIFKGKVRCTYCKKIFRTRSSLLKVNKFGDKKEYQYYYCENFRIGRCGNRYWQSPDIEKEFKKFLVELSNDDYSINIKNDNSILETIENKIKALKENFQKQLDRKKKLHFYLIDGVISKEDYIETTQSIDLIIEDIKFEIYELEKEKKAIEDEKIKEKSKQLAFNIIEIWDDLSNEEKKELINIFIKAIYMDKDRITHIDFIL